MPGTVRRWNYPSPLCIGMETCFQFSDHQSQETPDLVMPIVPQLNSASVKTFLNFHLYL